jgi:hypothetical protein
VVSWIHVKEIELLPHKMDEEAQNVTSTGLFTAKL